MTVFPAAKNLSKEHFYGGYFGGRRRCISNYTSYFDVMSRLERHDCSSDQACLGSDLVVFGPIMAAEDESRTDSVNEAGSSASKDVQQEIIKGDGNEDWLQLSIGGGHDQDHQIRSSRTSTGELIELNLLPSGNNNNNDFRSSQERGRVLAPGCVSSQFEAPRPLTNNNITSSPHYGAYATTSLFNLQPQQQGNSSSSFAHQEINWIYSHRPMTNLSRPIAIASSPSPSTLVAPPAYFSWPFQLHGGINVAAAGSSVDFTVIDPPPRPHSGIWFMLQASKNQAKEPFLPQIPKSYLRIKDGRMTIRLVIKYLVNKLRLESESEVEITCRGQQLQPLLTLQHVRDNLWNLRNPVVNLLPDSTSTPTQDHVMVLNYGRSAP